MPSCARLSSPGLGCAPPPTSATSEMVWCGARNGRVLTRPAPPGSRPATEWMDVTSRASASVSGGRMPARLLAIMVLPGARRAGEQDVMAAGRRHFERAAGRLLPADVGEVAARRVVGRRRSRVRAG